MLPSNYQCTGQISLFEYLQESQSGKTYPELYPQTTEKISDASLKSWHESKTPKLQYLNLKNGGVLGGLTHPWEVSHGESMTLNTGESPNAAVESHLSWILETNPNPKYNLSQLACQGILRRAKTRGKKLPELLERVLIQQSASKNEVENLGGVRESSYSTTTQEHCQRSTTKLYCNSSGEEVSGTLDASYYKGCGERQGTEREVVCVGNGQLSQAELSEKVGALNCMHD